jgi:hypothetical protein
MGAAVWAVIIKLSRPNWNCIGERPHHFRWGIRICPAYLQVSSKNIHSPRCQQHDNRERNDRLKHHQALCPAREDLRIRW